MRVVPFAIVLAALGGCGSSSSSDATTIPTTTTTTIATTTTSATAVPTSLSGASGGGGGGDGGGGTPTSPPAPTPVPTIATLPPSSEPDTSLLNTPDFGAYTVKQIETVGGESINGLVCDVRHPFVVNAATSKVAWVFLFTPTGNGGTGNVSYAYSIPSAGESHAATGTYTVTDSDQSGTRHVSLTVSDHVVFKGFDGNMPLHYKFDLVPASTCPAG
ncbi:MAG: hypothetical protein ACXWBO_11520 [Ilumatobacteraceae bacterium]